MRIDAKRPNASSRTIGFIVCATVCAGDSATAGARFPSGVYSDLQYNKEAGDLVGMAIEIRVGPPAYVTVLVEDGECQTPKKRRLHIVGDRLHFSVTHEAVDQSGHPLTLEPERFSGALNGSTLVLTASGGREAPERLRLARDPQAVLPACAKR